MKRLLLLLLSLTVLITAVFPVTVYAEENRYGYDVSAHNAVIDCQSAIDSGKSFYMIRLGYSDKYPDKNFLENVKAAYENHIDFGVYLYSYAYNAAEAQSEAAFALKTLAQITDYLGCFTLPVAYDLEAEKILQNADRTAVNQIMTAFCDSIRDAGYTPMVYANKNWFSNYIDTALVKEKGYKVWYANYPSGEPDFSTPPAVGDTGLYADIWQYKKGDAEKGTLDENVIFAPSQLVKPIACVHSYQTAVTKATLTKDGTVTEQCGKCGYIKSKTVISRPKRFQLSKTAYTYDSKEKKPVVTVTDASGAVIPSGSYTVQYADNVNVGTASVTVTFRGNYSGAKKLSFTVCPKGTSVAKLKAGKGAFTASWKKQAKQVTGYEIQYSLKKSFKGAKSVTVKGAAKTSRTVKKLKAKKTYYVRIRTYKAVGGKKYYSSWSKAKTVKTK